MASVSVSRFGVNIEKQNCLKPPPTTYLRTQKTIKNEGFKPWNDGLQPLKIKVVGSQGRIIISNVNQASEGPQFTTPGIP